MIRFGQRKRDTKVPEPTHWDVIHWLLKIDPPPPMGRGWLDGYMDGIYMVQCYLRGKAQGEGMNGDYASAVATAKLAVALNGHRSFPDEDEVEAG